MILGFLGILGVVFVADPIIDIVFGQEYDRVYRLLSILSLAIPFMFLRAALNRWIVITRLSGINVVIQAIGAVLNVGLGFLLIPRFGAEGAAVATVVSYGFATYGALMFSSQTRPLFVAMSKSLLQPWAALYRLWRFGRSYSERRNPV